LLCATSGFVCFFATLPTSLFYSLSLHDALPIYVRYADMFVRFQREAREEGRGLWGIPLSGPGQAGDRGAAAGGPGGAGRRGAGGDRKSTRLNSSHVKISYAVFCLKKKINA